MNERIRALAEQATDDILGVKILDDEKFAELIVRECQVALHPMLRDMISRGQAYDLIREYFGVER